MPTPGEPLTRLTVPTLDGEGFDTARDMGAGGALVIFYRGRHCPVCMSQLPEIDGMADEAASLGLALVAISGDGQATTRETAQACGLKRLRLGHDLTMTAARDWGLWISSARDGSEEPDLFTEPGIFHLLPDGSLYAAWVQSHPFARPAFGQVLEAVRFRQDKGYPARGAYRGPLAEHDGGVKIEAGDGPGAEAYGTP